MKTSSCEGVTLNTPDMERNFPMSQDFGMVSRDVSGHRNKFEKRKCTFRFGVCETKDHMIHTMDHMIPAMEHTIHAMDHMTPTMVSLCGWLLYNCCSVVFRHSSSSAHKETHADTRE